MGNTINQEQPRHIIGRRIAQIRTEKGLLQEQLSELTGIRQSHISRIERGLYDQKYETLVKIADALGYDVDFIKK